MQRGVINAKLKPTLYPQTNKQKQKKQKKKKTKKKKRKKREKKHFS